MPANRTEMQHKPVMLNETLELLRPRAGETFVDATLGLGGHAEAILNSAAETRLLGVDQDTEAIALASERLGKFGGRVQICHANFSEIKAVMENVGFEGADGILADLGVSSLQFDSPTRGFSFRFDSPLDMRMDAGSEGETVAELLERLSETEIARIIYEFGEERFSRRIARKIVERRERGEPVRSTKALAELVERAVRRGRKDKIHPATRTFQALRIAVNAEIEILDQFIRDSVEMLNAGGRLCLITFHSLEDRIVKRAFLRLAGKCSCPPKMPVCVCGAEKKVELLTRKPLAASESEIAENPRARSAKLRACLKLS